MNVNDLHTCISWVMYTNNIPSTVPLSPSLQSSDGSITVVTFPAKESTYSLYYISHEAVEKWRIKSVALEVTQMKTIMKSLSKFFTSPVIYLSPYCTALRVLSTTVIELIENTYTCQYKKYVKPSNILIQSRHTCVL